MGGYFLYLKFYSLYYVVLILHIKLVEVTAPAPDANDKVGVVLGVLLCIKQNFAVD